MKKMAFLTLSKLARQKLHEKRMTWATHRSQEALLRKEMLEGEATLKREKEFIREHPELQHAFEAFRKSLARHQATLHARRRALDAKIKVLQSAMGQLFQQVKSYEIPYERSQKTQQNLSHKSEQKALDDFAIDGFRRKAKKPFQPSNGAT